MEKKCEDPHRYDDILYLPRPVSTSHPHMAASDRAAQFSPFAALTGYDSAIKETARLTDEMAVLDEDSRAGLDERLRILKKRIDESPVVTITYFQPDERKEGGAYVSVSGAVRKIDFRERRIIMADKTAVLVDCIVGIEGELFDV